MKDVVGELEPDMLRSKEGTTSTSLTFLVGRGGGELFDDELLLKPKSTLDQTRKLLHTTRKARYDALYTKTMRHEHLRVLG